MKDLKKLVRYDGNIYKRIGNHRVKSDVEGEYVHDTMEIREDNGGWVMARLGMRKEL